MMTKPHDRYEQILKQLAEKRRAQSTEPIRQLLAQVLDELNVWQTLETTRKNAPEGIYAFGPRTIKRMTGNTPSCGVIIWYKSGGFYGYKLLTLLGVWAVQSDEVDVFIGRKQLAYSAPIYNPESYHRIIHKDYRPYYLYDSTPPTDEEAIRLTYTPQKRLSLRQQIADILLESIRMSR